MQDVIAGGAPTVGRGRDPGCPGPPLRSVREQLVREPPANPVPPSWAFGMTFADYVWLIEGRTRDFGAIEDLLDHTGQTVKAAAHVRRRHMDEDTNRRRPG
jgi:hypothetical protein